MIHGAPSRAPSANMVSTLGESGRFRPLRRRLRTIEDVAVPDGRTRKAAVSERSPSSKIVSLARDARSAFTSSSSRQTSAHRAIAFIPGGPASLRQPWPAICGCDEWSSLRGSRPLRLAARRQSWYRSVGSANSRLRYLRLPGALFPPAVADTLVRVTVTVSRRTRICSTLQRGVRRPRQRARHSGCPKLVLFGGSYGTRFYLDYARRHPSSVESIVLEGVAPPHFDIIPLTMARGAQTAIDHLEQACRHDPSCSVLFLTSPNILRRW